MGRAALILEDGQRATNDFGLCGSALFRDTRDQSFESSRQTNACSHDTLSYERVGHQCITNPLEPQEALDYEDARSTRQIHQNVDEPMNRET